MAQGIRLDLKQTQQLVMTPQLQQAIKLLQISNLELLDFVEREVESNPLILVNEAAADTDDPAANLPDPAHESRDELPEAPLDARLTREGDHALGEDTFDTGVENLFEPTPGDGTASLNGHTTTPSGASSALPHRDKGLGFDTGPFDLNQQPDEPASLRIHLLAQLGQCRAENSVLTMARLIVEELDEHGYLRTGLTDLTARLGASPKHAETALALVQGCDPTGVGARDLAECLALQLAERDRLDPAMRTMIDNLTLLALGERRRLRSLCGVDEEDFAGMVAEVRALDPRPCAAFKAERAETLIPDVLLRRAPWGGWEVELNSATLPRVLIDNRYAAELEGAGREARTFVTECRANATWLIRSLDQRARTILKIASEIVRHQDRFFAEGITGLRPLTLRMVADAAGVHESTASRVTSNKFIATERGIFELKFFFSNAVGTAGVTAETIRHRIRGLIGGEVPGSVLSDDAIVERLQQDGIDIARRTVVKYRRQMRIPSSIVRRRTQAAATTG